MTNALEKLPAPHHRLIAHRGLSAQAPENTWVAFREAAAFGLNWVEFDVQPCASGEWVLMHDLRLERTTNGQGIVLNTPLQTIRALDAGSWFDPFFEQEKVPELQETLEYVAMLGLHPNIEIKLFTEHGFTSAQKQKYLEVLLKNIEEAWHHTLALPLLSSFDLESLQILRKLSSKIPLGYNVHQLRAEHIDLSIDAQFQSLHCEYQKLHPHLIHAAIVKKLPLLVYTLNQSDPIQTLLNAGIYAVFSDITENIISNLLKTPP
jgi:glycerophosphoryl diester phosphodiesterase